MKSALQVHLGAIFLLLFVGLLDYLTGPELGFFVFYFLPVSIIAWFFGGRLAFCYSVAAILVWFVIEKLNQRVYSNEFYLYWNGAIRLFSFFIIGFLLARIKTALGREKELLSKELARSREEVKQLSGLLPICASCKQIRDDQGYWHQVESYIKSRTEVEFSHSICPVCMDHLYPNLVEKSS